MTRCWHLTLLSTWLPVNSQLFQFTGCFLTVDVWQRMVIFSQCYECPVFRIHNALATWQAKDCVLKRVLKFFYKLQSMLTVTLKSLITLIWFKFSYCYPFILVLSRINVQWFCSSFLFDKRSKYVNDIGYFDMIARCTLFITSCTRPHVAVAHSGEMEEKEERGSARFTYV
jgi:hypothetical protein